MNILDNIKYGYPQTLFIVSIPENILNKFNPNKKVQLMVIGLIIVVISAIGITYSLGMKPNGDTIAFSFSLAFFFLGIQMFYDGIKSCCKLN